MEDIKWVGTLYVFTVYASNIEDNAKIKYQV